jgi:predicted dehydrogenase
MTVDTYRLGLIGCGLIASAHGIAAERSNRDIRFSVCSSRSAESAKSFAEEFGCNDYYVDHRDLLRDNALHGIVIATPPDSHATIVEDCLQAGIKFILCEKPLTSNATEANAVRASANAAAATVLEGFMYRHHPQIAALRDLINSGELGAVDQIQCSINMLDTSETDGAALPQSWRREAEVGGVMHDFLCYPIDLANLILQQQPERALARVFTSPTYATPYRVFGMLEYGNGAVVSIAASRKSDFAQPLFVGCEKGSMRLDTAFNPIGDTQIIVQKSTGLIGQHRDTIHVPVPDPVSERLIDLPVFLWQLEHFADLIDGEKTPIMTLDESLRNAVTRDALIESGVTNAWVHVDRSMTSR